MRDRIALTPSHQEALNAAFGPIDSEHSISIDRNSLLNASLASLKGFIPIWNFFEVVEDE